MPSGDEWNLNTGTGLSLLDWTKLAFPCFSVSCNIHRKIDQLYGLLFIGGLLCPLKTYFLLGNEVFTRTTGRDEAVGWVLINMTGILIRREDRYTGRRGHR